MSPAFRPCVPPRAALPLLGAKANPSSVYRVYYYNTATKYLPAVSSLLRYKYFRPRWRDGEGERRGSLCMAGRQCQGECRAVALGDASCTGAFLWLQGTAGQAGSIAGAAPGAEPPTTHPGAAQRQDQGSILLWGQHKEAHMVTPGMAMMLSQARCGAQHCAWSGRSKICPSGFIPFPKTLLGLAAGQWQSQACGWGCPAARQGWGR